MIPTDVIAKWKSTWCQLLDMAYHGKNVSAYLFVNNFNYHDLYVWSKNEPEFEKLTFDYYWKQYSQLRGSNGAYLEPNIVPELKEMYIPRILFNTIGINTFIKICIPTCSITYWEDDCAV